MLDYVQNHREFSLRAILLGCLISLILVGANAYLSLKVGLTIAASIPSAIAAILTLRWFKDHTIFEANIIQAIASSGEAVIAAAVFTIPSLIIFRFWHYFHFWETALLTLLGAFLGILFSIPFRRIFFREQGLLFPEGVATAEILKLSDRESQSPQGSAEETTTVPKTIETHKNHKNEFTLLIWGGLAATIIKVSQSGLRVLSESIEGWWVKGHALLGYGFDFSPALLGVGYIIGLPATFTIFAGTLVTWLLGLPLYTYFHHTFITHSYHQVAFNVWEHYLRYIGIGVMLLAAVHTLVRLAKPIYQGLALSFYELFQKKKTQQWPQYEQDIPILYVIIGLAATLIGVFLFLQVSFLHVHLPFKVSHYLPVTLSWIFILIFAFIFTMIAGYLTGLIGSTNMPISGLTVLSLLLSSLLLILCCGLTPHRSADAVAVSAFIIMTNAILTCVMSTAALHTQCLKTSSIIQATPYKQELAFLIGVIPGALIIVPIMQLMFSAYGIAGIFPHPGMDPAQMLSAPQATLIAETTLGVLSGHIPWLMVFFGLGLGAVAIGINKFLIPFPPMAFGLGMFLPPGISGPLVLGGLIAHLVDKRFRQKNALLAQQLEEKSLTEKQFNLKKKNLDQQQEHTKRQGLLLSCGYIAGESISGIVLAIPFVIAGNDRILTIMPQNFTWIAHIAGMLTFMGLVYWMGILAFQPE
ncbi:MAG: oligopeptide transporter, OPT family [Gammaproteobacteria bacterium]|nr:oligopeptide transporter, OPT family [Gammaproteobacteria bacterium]